MPTADTRQDAFLPTPYAQNHAANLHELADGTLLCTWFAGTQEGMADIFVLLSRRDPATGVWSEPQKMSEDSSRSEQNPILFQAPGGPLWLIWTAQISGNQETAIIRRRLSLDNGQSWGPIDTLFDEPGTFVRQPPVVLDNGDWLLPVWYCITGPGEKWVGNHDVSAVMISTDQGHSWTRHDVPDSTGSVHMNVHQLPDGSLLGLFRSRWADFIYSSRSTDRGRSWSAPTPTELPNNNSSIQFVKLATDELALVYNPVSAEGHAQRRASLYDEIEDEGDDRVTPGARQDGKAAVWGIPRAPMSLAISRDGGHSWPTRLDLELGDGFCLTNNSQEKLNREFSYPSIIQAADGSLHVAFTYFRQKIKHVHLPLNAIR
ncbi:MULTISPECIES: sialidase family protein [Pseudomonas syringae group]|uniref:Glycosyl hydrolase n=11 Tax=Pseudomonas syringae group TaxID=136849 RepID=A0A2K4WSC3_PSESX|nr:MULTISPECIES: exo-alpha-sialidase [Pseudomonas syringae group]KPW65572.1 BNR/Asp-box repeat-containing protein [Pseudomonas syringae pv. broussonetiae]ARA80402.1 glycosyl hydrolase [Pseudomonas amygdali pv. lachrymans]AVB15697.1 glycosyl hydrolase [Pseudomonas amygdali pv. morsprunorum]AXH55833.1 glycosyl hydrolase [Pseudomonas amygdali pv. lachrymans str. M301315]EGH01096.1 BNR/Asp-box repeat-containing protein [Pseudomonas amygdali pv. aesculi str. 0893_23]